MKEFTLLGAWDEMTEDWASEENSSSTVISIFYCYYLAQKT